MSRTNLDSTKDHLGDTRITASSLQYDPANYPNKIMVTRQSVGKGTLYRLVEKRTGTVTPRYGWKLDNGQNTGQNDFFYTKSTLSYPFTTSFEFGDNYTSTSSGPFDGYYYKADTNLTSGISPVLITNQRNAAIIQLRGKLKGMSVNVAQAYAERDRSIKLVGDSLLKLVGAALAVRKGDIKGAMAKLPGRVKKGAVSSSIDRIKKEGAGAAFGRNWLELQYGWRPLVSDVYGACEALDKARRKMPLLKAVGRASRTYDTSRVVNESAYRKLTYKTSVRRDVKFTAFVKVNDGGAHTIASLGLTNPATIAWELMPWSFVVDWAIPIGPWIEGMDSMIGLDFVSCSETLFVDGESHLYNRYYKARTASPSSTEVTEIQESSFKVVEVTRTILGSIPAAYFPYVKNPMSGQHVANALALLLAGPLAGKR